MNPGRSGRNDQIRKGRHMYFRLSPKILEAISKISFGLPIRARRGKAIFCPCISLQKAYIRTDVSFLRLIQGQNLSFSSSKTLLWWLLEITGESKSEWKGWLKCLNILIWPLLLYYSKENADAWMPDTVTENILSSASFDGAWQKQGSWHAFNSLSGDTQFY